MTAPDQPDWPCEAYGPDGLEIGAWCFVGGLRQRWCPAPEECREIVAEARERIFTRINEMAADGNPTGVYLAEQFPTPQDIMKGEDIT